MSVVWWRGSASLAAGERPQLGRKLRASGERGPVRRALRIGRASLASSSRCRTMSRARRPWHPTFARWARASEAKNRHRKVLGSTHPIRS